MFVFTILFSCKNNKKDEEINNIEKETSNENNVVATEKSYEDDISPKIKYVNSPEGLNLRSSANIKSDKITTIPNRSVVEIIDIDKNLIVIDDIQNNWYFVNYNGITGWIFGGYLTDVLPFEVPVIVGKWKNVNDSDIRFIFESDYTYQMFGAVGVDGGTWSLIGNVLNLEGDWLAGDGDNFITDKTEIEYFNLSVSIIDKDNIILNLQNMEQDKNFPYFFRQELILQRIENIWDF
jgi:uncharacterized protein YgiM (DUF1202 family)